MHPVPRARPRKTRHYRSAGQGGVGELLEAKLVRGTYPPGYTPKRPTAIMPPQPQLAKEIPALAAYLE